MPTARMCLRRWAGLWVGLLVVLAYRAEWRACGEEIEDRIPAVLTFSRAQLADFCLYPGNLDPGNADAGKRARYWSYTDAYGNWLTSDAYGWPAGHQPGCMWLICKENPGDTELRSWAETWTTPIAANKGGAHDQSFHFQMTFVPWYELTGDTTKRQPALDAAASVAATFNQSGAVVNAFKTGVEGTAPANYKVLIDHNMDVELVLWAGKQSANAEYLREVVSHLRIVAQTLVRADGGSAQNGYFDPATGMYMVEGTKQGYASWSTWSRGQAWAIYAFTVGARETGLADLRATAEKLADYYIARLPSDSIPYWDFQAPGLPNEPRDSSAGAVATSALLQLSKLTPDPAASQRYWNAARNALLSMSELAPDDRTPAPYLAQSTDLKSLLQHGTYYKLNNSYDTGLAWGDYYFLEGLLRYRDLLHPPGDPLVTITATVPSVPEAGPGTAEFTFTRTGDTSQPLTVAFSALGNAVVGTDFVTLPTCVIIPCGAASAALPITPIDNSRVDGERFLTLTLANDPAYHAALPYAATITITDDDIPTLSVDKLANGSETGPTAGTFRVSRAGGSAALPVTAAIVYYGTAVSGTDYTTSHAASVTIAAGSSYTDVTITPLDDAIYQGTRTVTLTLANSTTSAYLLGTPRTATLTIEDNDLPPTPGTGTGLGASYFDNASSTYASTLNFSGFAVGRVDAGVAFNWGSGTPDPRLGADTFSVRWHGQVEAQFSEAYTFYVYADDGAKLWVNNQLIIDKWASGGAEQTSTAATLVAGTKYDLKLEYYENTGNARAELRWSSARTLKQLVPASQLYPDSPPTISALADQSTDVGTALPPLPFQTNDAETPGSVTVSAASSNLTLVPLSGIVLAGANGSWTVTVTPAAGPRGQAIISLTASDGYLCSSASFVVTVGTPAGVHPRLYFGPDDIAGLRARLQTEPYQSMYNRLFNVDKDGNSGGGGTWDPANLYDVGERAMRYGFLYVLTGDDACAQTARAMVTTLINDSTWASSSLKGLSSYRYGNRVAMAYDWCYSAPSWDPAFRFKVSTKLLTMAEMIYTSGGTEQNTSPASNWQGNRFSAAGLCYLACDEASPSNEVMTLSGWSPQGSADGAWNTAQFNNPYGVALDGSGNLYVAEYADHTIRKIASDGTVTTLAGKAGSSGSTDAVGSAARFKNPTGVAVDGSGNVYVADYNNHTIRKVAADGTVTTLAGVAGSSGTADGNATTARFKNPAGVAVDGGGNVYVADYNNHTIRKIVQQPAVAVSTLAGVAGSSGSANGNATTARFKNPSGLAVDGDGNLYVADYANNMIRKIAQQPAVAVTTLAGTTSAGNVDGNAATARFRNPYGVSVNSAGNVYVADYGNHTIRQIAQQPSVAVTTPAGRVGYAGYDDGAGAVAQFYSPTGVAADGTGNVYVADMANHRVRLVDTTPAVSTFAGGSAGDDTTVAPARLWMPKSMAVDAAGNVYVADTHNHTLRRITPAGLVSTLAGLAGNPGAADGSGPTARFRSPAGLALDPAGHLLVADTGNHTIRKVTLTGVVTTLAGLAGTSGTTNGAGADARFNRPCALAVDAGHNVYIADTGNHTIRLLVQQPSVTVSLLLGIAGTAGSTDGGSGVARFNGPAGIAVDGTGNLYVADTLNHTLRLIVQQPAVSASTLAGTAGSSGSTDGTGSAARFLYPAGLTLDPAGNLYVADSVNHIIRKVVGNVVSLFAGKAATPGTTDGAAANARFLLPAGVAADGAGNLYVADSGNNTVRKYMLARVSGCYHKTATYLQQNLGTGPSDSHGWNIEGLGYTYYPMGCFVGGFGVAMQLKDANLDLREACAGALWNFWSAYASVTKIMGTILHPDFGDDNPAVGPQGTLGLAFWWTAALPELHPGFVYWYGQTVGANGTQKWEGDSGGTVYSYLFHPGAAVPAQNPLASPAWLGGFSDTGGNGLFTWRNRYADQDDMLGQLYVKLRGNKGHSGPDGLSFRIFGLDTAWAVGGGRYGSYMIHCQDAYYHSQNALYPVDPDDVLTISGNSGVVDGTPVVKADGGGHIVCHVGTSNLNVQNWRRRFVADYSGASGAAAAYVICDTSDNGRWWQICTVESNTITTEGNTFTISGAGGQTLRGTVLYPTSEWNFKVGRRRRGTDFNGYGYNNYLHFQSADGCFVVVLTVSASGQTPILVTGNGTWGANPNGSVSIGRLGMTLAGNSITYAPYVAGASPGAGPVDGGTSVTLTGANFTAGAAVTFGGAPAASATVLNSTQIACVTPTHDAGAADVAVVNPDGQGDALPAGYEFLPPPGVTSVTPGRGPTSGLTPVTVTGSGFATSGNVTVSFGTPTASSVTVFSSTRITCVTPTHSAGKVPVKVTNPNGQSGTLTNGFEYKNLFVTSVQTVAPTDPLQTPKYGKVELLVTLQGLSATHLYDFDPAAGGVDLSATFSGPPGAQTVSGFYDGQNFRVRFAPTALGAYTFTVTATDPGGSDTWSGGSLTCVASAAPGFARVDGLYLRFTEGQSFYGVGHNNGWQYDVEQPSLTQMALRGENLLSFWLSAPWVEQGGRAPIENLQQGLGNYNPAACAYLDGVVGRAEAAGVYLLPTIYPHCQLRGDGHPWGTGNWDNNPYSTVCTADDFFRTSAYGGDTSQWRYQKNFFRYLLARWGYSRAVTAWVVVCEIDGTSGYYANYTQALAWCASVRDYFAARDFYRLNASAKLPLAVSRVDNDGTPFDCGLGMLATDSYAQYANDIEVAQAIASETAGMRALSRPSFMGEFGGDLSQGATQPRHLHNGLWAGLASGAALSPLVWCDGQNYPLLTDATHGEAMRSHLQYHADFAAGLPYQGDASLVAAGVSLDAGYCRGWGMRRSNRGFAWIQNTLSGGTLGGQQLTVSSLVAGTYQVLWYDTWTNGKRPFNTTQAVTVSGDGNLRALIPALPRADVACRFEEVSNLPVATLTASQPLAAEHNLVAGAFTVTLSSPAPPGGLTVCCQLDGASTATSGADFEVLPGAVDFQAGETSKAIPVVPLQDSIAEDPDETVRIVLLPGPLYVVGTPASATVTIADDDLVFVNASYPAPDEDTDGDKYFKTILPAVGYVQSGGTVVVADGTYPEQVSLTKPLVLHGNVNGGVNGLAFASGGTGAVIQPGAPAGRGRLHFVQSADFSGASGATLRIRLAGTAQAGTDYDQLWSSQGTLTLGGSSVLVLDLAGLPFEGTGGAKVPVAVSSALNGVFSAVQLLNNAHNLSALATYDYDAGQGLYLVNVQVGTGLGHVVGLTVSAPVQNGNDWVTTFTGTRSADSAGPISFNVWLKVNGAWNLVQPWSTSASYTLSAPADGAYEFYVEARAGLTGSDAAAHGPAFIVGSYVTGVTVNPATVNQETGQVTLTYSASGTAPAPQFQVWLRTSYGVLTVVQRWSTATTWTATVTTAGTYTPWVEARSAAGRREASAYGPPFQVTGP